MVMFHAKPHKLYQRLLATPPPTRVKREKEGGEWGLGMGNERDKRLNSERGRPGAELVLVVNLLVCF